MNKLAGWIIGFVVLVLALLGWSEDFVTLQGEKTIYTVRCDGAAAWHGVMCPGKLTAGDRYRFRALKLRHEVIFWRLGSDEPSGKFSRCDVKSGHDWSCQAGADAGRSIGLAMTGGRLLHDASGATRPFQAVSKWKWWLLRFGVGSFHRADY